MRQRIEALDWLRGIAALWVLSYHANLVVQNPRYFGGPSLGLLPEVGYRGVELFFVISGFVMAETAPFGAKNDWRGMRGFAVRRLFRIFPAYLAVFIPLAMLGLLTGLEAPETGTIQGNLLSNVFLLPRDDVSSYVPVVAWTLTHELMFYAIFATAYVNRSLAFTLLVAWCATAVAFHAGGVIPSGWRMQLSLLNLYFLVGLAAARLRQLMFVPPSLLIICAVGATAWAMHLEGPIVKTDLSARTALYMVGFGALVLLVAQLSPPIRKAWHSPLRWLGEQSYSLYLIHYPVIIAVAMVLVRLHSGSGVLPPIAVVLALGVSRLIYVLVERPGMSVGRALSNHPVRAVVENRCRIGAAP